MQLQITSKRLVSCRVLKIQVEYQLTVSAAVSTLSDCNKNRRCTLCDVTHYIFDDIQYFYVQHVQTCSYRKIILAKICATKKHDAMRYFVFLRVQWLTGYDYRMITEDKPPVSFLFSHYQHLCLQHTHMTAIILYIESSTRHRVGWAYIFAVFLRQMSKTKNPDLVWRSGSETRTGNHWVGCSSWTTTIFPTSQTCLPLSK